MKGHSVLARRQAAAVHPTIRKLRPDMVAYPSASKE